VQPFDQWLAEPTLGTPEQHTVAGDFTELVWPPFDQALEEPGFDQLALLPRDALASIVRDGLSAMGISRASVERVINPIITQPEYRAIDQAASDYIAQATSSLPAQLAVSYLYVLGHHPDAIEQVARRTNFAQKLIMKITELWGTRVIREDIESRPVQVATIHTPHVRESSCIYRDVAATEGSWSHSVRILGFGGGGKIIARVEVGREHTARDGRCYAIIKQCRVKVEECQQLRLGRVMKTYDRVSPLGLMLGYKKRALSGADDACRVAERLNSEPEPIDLTDARDPDSTILRIHKDQSVSFSLDVPIARIATQVSCRVDLSAITDKTLTYDLPGGRLYKAYPLADELGFAWTASAGRSFRR
jgi:hypothetical protein